MDSENLEKLIIKGCIESKDFLSTVIVFQKEYFDNEKLSKAFEFLVDYLSDYNAIAPRAAIIDHVGDEEIFKELDSIEFDVAANYDYLLNETNKYLKDKAIKKAILDSVEIIDKEEEKNKIREIVENALCKDLKINLGLNYFNDLKSRITEVLTASTKIIPTYFPTLDEFINGGFPPYTLSVIASRIHGWKSSALANVAARQVRNGHNVVLLSMEMAINAFAQRFDSIFTGFDINRIYTVRKVREEFIKRIKEIKKMENGNLIIEQFPTGEANVIDFKRYLRELQMRDLNPDIIYVDYMNLMKPSYKTKGDMYSDVKKISEELRALSYDFNAPVVSVTQLNREGSSVTLEELDFIHIAESLGIASTSDFIMIFGDDEDKRVYESEIFYKIVKNRFGGRVGEIDKFFYDSRSLKMYDSMELNQWKDDAELSGDDRNLAEIKQTEFVGRRGRKRNE